MAYSEYFNALSGDVKERYRQKIRTIGGVDPYTLQVQDLSRDLSVLPEISSVDLFTYFISTHSFYTGQQLKAYKSLQAYKYYEAGFVQEVLAKEVNEETFVVVGKVKHSQRIREQPLKVWVIILKTGDISCAHCTCMAGLGEVCSHVAAIIFYLTSRPMNVSCTDILSKWPVPAIGNVDMRRIRDLPCARTVTGPVNASPMSLERFTEMIKYFRESGCNSVVGTLLEPIASEIAAENSLEEENLPPTLDSLYDEEFTKMNLEELLRACGAIKIEITSSEIEAIEKATKGQAKSNIWFKYRCGRITASNFKAATKSSLKKPSLSLVKKICYPEKVKFYSKQTSYGLKFEGKALKQFEDVMVKLHRNVTVESRGFIISVQNPIFGASPDAIVNCDCCGTGCVEVKCPFNLQDKSLTEYTQQKYSCLENVNGIFSLKRSHQYYYQVQLQMWVTSCSYCDFIVWSKNTFFKERITYNNEFCSENIEKAMKFHNNIVMPEIIARYFTREGSGQVERWCVCSSPDDGTPMLKCENQDCSVQWYHFTCMGLLDVPEDIWFCPRCIGSD